MPDIFALHGNKTTLLVSVVNSVPQIIYWGSLLKNWKGYSAATDAPVPQGTLDQAVPFSLPAESGRGLLLSPGIEGHRDGRDWAPVFHVKSSRQDDSQIEILCGDLEAGLQTRYSISMDKATDLVSFQQSLTNTGNKAISADYQLQRFDYSLPLPGYMTECHSYGGRWCQEWIPHKHELMHGALLLENRTGRTSHQKSPNWLVGTSGLNETAGEVYGMHLAWSGNHHCRIEVASSGQRFIQTGELLLPGEICLASGDTYHSPTLYGTYSAKGVQEITHNFHRYIREQVVQWPGTKVRPILLNTWEGIYFDHNPDYIKKMASHTQALGCERFVIDDGWFVGRNGEKTALGDWFVDEKKYPEGLTPIIQHVKAQGLQFGIWVEPEMISPDSKLCRQHPDWVLKLDGYHPPLGRYQEILDLQNPEAYDYIFERLDNLLSAHDIDYVKWDMNREFIQAGHQGKAAVHGQTKALYRLLAELCERHPSVEIESCASGGGRIDMGILQYTQRFWTSDCNDALERVRIQNGYSIFFPPELMGAHLGAPESHTTRRRHSVEFRAAVALFGHFGLELDPVKLSAEDSESIKAMIDLHKQLRPTLHQGTWYRLEAPEDPGITSWLVVSEDQRHAVLGVFQTAMPRYGVPAKLRLCGLNEDANYRINVCLQDKYVTTTMKHVPSWLEEPTVTSAGWLQQGGIQLPVMDPESALLITLSTESS